MAEEYASIGVQLGARYDGSPIIAADGAPPADDYVNYTPSGVPGGRAPHFWLGDGRGYGNSLFDRLGTGFTLLRLGGSAPTPRAIEAAARQRGVPLTVLDVPLRRRARSLRRRSRADPARSIRRLARQCAARRSGPAVAQLDRRGLSANLPCATSRQIDFRPPARQSKATMRATDAAARIEPCRDV